MLSDPTPERLCTPALEGPAVRPEIVSPLVIALCFLGCASAYDRTYDQELGQLRNQ